MRLPYPAPTFCLESLPFRYLPDETVSDSQFLEKSHLDPQIYSAELFKNHIINTLLRPDLSDAYLLWNKHLGIQIWSCEESRWKKILCFKYCLTGCSRGEFSHTLITCDRWDLGLRARRIRYPQICLFGIRIVLRLRKSRHMRSSENRVRVTLL